MAKTAEIINGQDERCISCASVGRPVCLCEWVIKAGKPENGFPPILILREETLQNQKKGGQALCGIGRLVHKAERRTRDGDFPICPVCGGNAARYRCRRWRHMPVLPQAGQVSRLRVKV